MTTSLIALADLVACAALFLGTVFGLGLPWVTATRLSPSEKICVAAAAGLVGIYLLGMTAFVIPVFAPLRSAGPWLAGLALAFHWRSVLTLSRDATVKRMLLSHLLVVAWALGWLALVRSYSGASWALDWLGHYERAQIFGGFWPEGRTLFGGDVLPSRPPLANVVTGSFLHLSGLSFVHFQIFTTLASTLAFLPGWIWATRFGRGSPVAPAVLTLLFLLNPSMIQNATFAWTKLPTVFLVLAGLLLYLPPPGEKTSPRRLAAAFLLLAAGLLSHYSAAPYILAVAAAYGFACRFSWKTQAFWITSARAALPASLLLLTWFGWAISQYGPAGAFLSNTSVTQTDTGSAAEFVTEKLTNFFNTLVPHVLRPVDYAFIQQASPLGTLRDFAFLLYQVNLPLLFGSVGSALLVRLLLAELRRDRLAEDSSRGFWVWFVSCTVVLGTAANGGVDAWGIAHLCLLGLLGLGLAFIAARAPSLSRGWILAGTAGLVVDFSLGIVLHFHLQNHLFTATDLSDNAAGVMREFGPGAWLNLQYKLATGWSFLGEEPLARPLIAGGLLMVLGAAVALVREAHGKRGPNNPSGYAPPST